jgi:hypothetical protein
LPQREQSEARDYTIPVTRCQKELGENESVVLIASKGMKLSPNRVGSGLWNFFLFIIAGVFLMLGFVARYLDGRSVKSTPWGLHIVEATQLVISLPISSASN